nr:MAG TPA: hypothetical protein [Caudoviricetes sp.]
MKHYSSSFLVNLNEIILFHNLFVFKLVNSSARGTCTTCKAFNLWRIIRFKNRYFQSAPYLLQQLTKSKCKS